MMPPRLSMKRLQSECPAQRTIKRPSTLPELPTFSTLETKPLRCHTVRSQARNTQRSSDQSNL
ncbi:hypothetical protein CLF_101112 [Clonorchis sinensis]|uniref:Uncharacterized protein n=1 Tax=Clonorchis sinensis TaxID=79923 RepID=G7Y508_CLOSI|nr:hypothetical protein CLF_101112 [Clonorchis sinensis]